MSGLLDQAEVVPPGPGVVGPADGVGPVVGPALGAVVGDELAVPVGVGFGFDCRLQPAVLARPATTANAIAKVMVDRRRVMAVLRSVYADRA
ncbi:MAG TPA: hypothetical protein VF163_01900 [Micromonosporaceae bacterium]